jgi:hypothetical protein
MLKASEPSGYDSGTTILIHKERFINIPIAGLGTSFTINWGNATAPIGGG